ncbi:DUF6879 family protein [Streptomyces uncialis]|uniref:DUF6879 family protein n=1 Tax=Streptomyces uncialis TaxID=1048205 RepID=UPI00224DF179|nr:DUF6879 family protein [Streptomyces uncialis]MCX4663538.1 hypothetical protein [Streptomyces uncialis]WST70736.1 hypothetical protein OG268_26860 [Streptomyces uncialis]
MKLSGPVFEFDEVLARSTRSAVHLEMRDSYAVDNETGRYAEWKSGKRHDPENRSAWWRPWHSLVAATVARGVVVRRARIVSEPVSEYIRFEYDGTFMNVAAGELVRWLPRRHTSDLALPGNDFWVFDDSIVRFGHFSGDGEYLGEEWTQTSIAAEACASAFEAVWRRATPHEDYKV